MTLCLDHPALKLYALVATILALQMLFLAPWTGKVRVQHKVWVNPEDAAFNKGKKVDEDHEEVLRVKRAHQNLVENALPFFIIGLLYALTKPSTLGAQAYFFTILGTRVLHSIFYLLGRQPFRTLMFAMGVLAMIGMAIHVIRAAL